uniref:Vacuolar protein 8 n=1 Tax=Lotharella globosa TaxID=91324 RepID=A0A7S4DS21_9EUKA
MMYKALDVKELKPDLILAPFPMSSDGLGSAEGKDIIPLKMLLRLGAYDRLKKDRRQAAQGLSLFSMTPGGQSEVVRYRANDGIRTLFDGLFYDDHITQLYSCIALTNISSNLIHRTKLVQSGIIERMYKLASNENLEDEIRVSALCCLGHLAATPELHHLFHTFVPKTMTFLFSPSYLLQRNAAVILHNLSCNKALWLTLMNNRVITATGKMLATASANIQAQLHMLRVLENLAIEDEIRVEVAKSGILAETTHLLVHTTSAGLRTELIFMYSILTASRVSHSFLMNTPGALESILMLLEDNSTISDKMLYFAVSTVGNLSANPDYQARVIEAGGLNQLVKLLARQSLHMNTCIQTLRALAGMATSRKIHNVLLKKDCFELALSCTPSSVLLCQRFACLLVAFFSEHPHVCQRLAEPTTVARFLKIAAEPHTPVHTIRYCLLILANVASAQVNHRVLMDEIGKMNYVKFVDILNNSDNMVLHNYSLFISNLSTSKENQERLSKARLLAKMRPLMSLPQKKIVYNVMCYLANISALPHNAKPIIDVMGESIVGFVDLLEPEYELVVARTLLNLSYNDYCKKMLMGPLRNNFGAMIKALAAATVAQVRRMTVMVLANISLMEAVRHMLLQRPYIDVILSSLYNDVKQQESALLACINITSSPQSVRQLNKMHFVTQLSACLSSPHATCRIESYICLAHFAEHELAHVDLMEVNLVQFFLNLCVKQAVGPMIVEKRVCLLAVCNFCRHKTNHRYLTNTGVLLTKAIIECFDGATDKYTMLYGAQTLSNLSITMASNAMFSDTLFLQKVIKLSHACKDYRTKHYLLLTLRNLARHRSYGLKFLETNMAAYLVTEMNSPLPAECAADSQEGRAKKKMYLELIRYQIMHIVFNLSMSGAFSIDLVRKGAVPALITVLDAPATPANIQVLTAKTLANFGSSGEYASVRGLMERGAAGLHCILKYFQQLSKIALDAIAQQKREEKMFASTGARMPHKTKDPNASTVPGLTKGELEVLQGIGWCFASLVADPKNQKEVFRWLGMKKSLEYITTFLNCPISELQTAGGWVIATITSNPDPKGAPMIKMYPDIINTLARLVNDPDTAQAVSKYCMHALSSISHNPEDHKDLLSRAKEVFLGLQRSAATLIKAADSKNTAGIKTVRQMALLMSNLAANDENHTFLQTQLPLTRIEALGGVNDPETRLYTTSIIQGYAINRETAEMLVNAKSFVPMLNRIAMTTVSPETHRAISAAFCSLSGFDHLINQLLNQQILTGLIYLGLSNDIIMQAYVVTCLCRLLTANTSKDYADTFSSPLQQVLDHEKGAHAVWNLLQSESQYVAWETVRLLTLLIQHERAQYVIADVQVFRRILQLGLTSTPKPDEKKKRRKKKKKKKKDDEKERKKQEEKKKKEADNDFEKKEEIDKTTWWWKPSETAPHEYHLAVVVRSLIEMKLTHDPLVYAVKEESHEMQQFLQRLSKAAKRGMDIQADSIFLLVREGLLDLLVRFSGLTAKTAIGPLNELAHDVRYLGCETLLLLFKDPEITTFVMDSDELTKQLTTALDVVLNSCPKTSTEVLQAVCAIAVKLCDDEKHGVKYQEGLMQLPLFESIIHAAHISPPASPIQDACIYLLALLGNNDDFLPTLIKKDMYLKAWIHVAHSVHNLVQDKRNMALTNKSKALSKKIGEKEGKSINPKAKGLGVENVPASYASQFCKITPDEMLVRIWQMLDNKWAITQVWVAKVFFNLTRVMEVHEETRGGVADTPALPVVISLLASDNLLCVALGIFLLSSEVPNHQSHIFVTPYNAAELLWKMGHLPEEAYRELIVLSLCKLTRIPKNIPFLLQGTKCTTQQLLFDLMRGTKKMPASDLIKSNALMAIHQLYGNQSRSRGSLFSINVQQYKQLLALTNEFEVDGKEEDLPVHDMSLQYEKGHPQNFPLMALTLLCNLSAIRENHEAVIETGVMQQILKTLMQGEVKDSKFTRLVVMILSNIAANPENHKRIDYTDTTRVLGKIAKASSEAVIQRLACLAICNMCSSYMIMKSGFGVDKEDAKKEKRLLPVMDVLRIARLSEYVDGESTRFLAAGLCMVTTHPDYVFPSDPEDAVRDQDKVPSNAALKTAYCGFLESVLHMLNTKSAGLETVHYALQILTNISLKLDCLHECLFEKKVLKKFLEIVESDDPAMQVLAIRVLRRFSANRLQREKMVRSKRFPAIMRLVKSDKPNIRMHVAQMLCTFVHVPKQDLVKVGKVMLPAMIHSGQSADQMIYFFTVMAFFEFLKYDENLKLLVQSIPKSEENGLTVICRVLVSPPKCQYTINKSEEEEEEDKKDAKDNKEGVNEKEWPPLREVIEGLESDFDSDDDEDYEEKVRVEAVTLLKRICDNPKFVPLLVKYGAFGTIVDQLMARVFAPSVDIATILRNASINKALQADFIRDKGLECLEVLLENKEMKIKLCAAECLRDLMPYLQDHLEDAEKAFDHRVLMHLLKLILDLRHPEIEKFACDSMLTMVAFKPMRPLLIREKIIQATKYLIRKQKNGT